MLPRRQFQPGPASSPGRVQRRYRAEATPPHIDGGFRFPAASASNASLAVTSNPDGLAGHAHALAAIGPAGTQSRLLRPSASGKMSHVRSFASILACPAACPVRVKLAIL